MHQQREQERRRRPVAAWWGELPPAAGSAVMATGIVSVGLHMVGREGLPVALLALGAAAWAALAADFVARLLRDRTRWEAEADTPPALTAVAATTVLGTRVVLALVWLWYLVLVLAELLRPRPHYDMRRWATVFPMGMTAVATLATATAASLDRLQTPGQVLMWLAAAAWALTLIGLLRSLRGPQPA